MKTRQQQRKEIKNQRVMGVIAVVLSVAGFVLPKFWWMTAPIGVILGGEARVSKDGTNKVLGVIAEVVIALQIIIMYAYCFNILAK